MRSGVALLSYSAKLTLQIKKIKNLEMTHHMTQLLWLFMVNFYFLFALYTYVSVNKPLSLK